MNTRPHLICFDLGRVLVRICDGWRHACERVGIQAPTGELDSISDAGLHDAICKYETAETTLAQFCDECGKHLRLQPNQIKALSDAYILGVYEGVPELLSDLRSAGYATACLSNTNDNHWRIIDDPAEPYVAALRQLNHRFASHLLRDRKPNSSIYEKVEKALSLSGEQIVFFDDLPENVDAAKARGWQAYAVAIDAEPVPQMRQVLKSLAILR